MEIESLKSAFREFGKIMWYPAFLIGFESLEGQELSPYNPTRVEMCTRSEEARVEWGPVTLHGELMGI